MYTVASKNNEIKFVIPPAIYERIILKNLAVFDSAQSSCFLSTPVYVMQKPFSIKIGIGEDESIHLNFSEGDKLWRFEGVLPQ